MAATTATYVHMYLHAYPHCCGHKVSSWIPSSRTQWLVGHDTQTAERGCSCVTAEQTFSQTWKSPHLKAWHSLTFVAGKDAKLDTYVLVCTMAVKREQMWAGILHMCSFDSKHHAMRDHLQCTASDHKRSGRHTLDGNSLIHVPRNYSYRWTGRQFLQPWIH